MQEDMVAGAFGKILSIANTITTGILKTPLEYRDGEIGRFEGPTWISHRTFSGLEKAISYAGISVALAGECPIKIVMIDEVLIHPDNQRLLLDRALELTAAGKISQFVLVDVHAENVPAGVNVIRV
jgi:hypothetical protein